MLLQCTRIHHTVRVWIFYTWLCLAQYMYGTILAAPLPNGADKNILRAVPCLTRESLNHQGVGDGGGGGSKTKPRRNRWTVGTYSAWLNCFCIINLMMCIVRVVHGVCSQETDQKDKTNSNPVCETILLKRTATWLLSIVCSIQALKNNTNKQRVLQILMIRGNAYLQHGTVDWFPLYRFVWCRTNDHKLLYRMRLKLVFRVVTN